MRFLERILDVIQSHLMIWIVASVAAGLLVSYLTPGFGFSALICLLAALVMIYPSLVPLSFDRLTEIVGHGRPVLFSLGLNFIVSPAIAYAIGSVFLSGFPEYRLGLTLLSLLPGGGMVTTWATRSKADMPATVGIILANLAVAVLIVPLSFPILVRDSFLPGSDALPSVSESSACPLGQATAGVVTCGAAVSAGISPWKIAVPILFIVVVPAVLAWLTQRVLLRRGGIALLDRAKVLFGKAGNAGLVIVLFVLMGLHANREILTRPSDILPAIVPVVLFYTALFLVAGFAAGRIADTAVRRAFFWGSSLRYLTLALGLSISFAFQNPDMLRMSVVVVLSYLVQIPASFRVAQRMRRAES
ncbi:MAG: hypothetical protein HGB18_02215 [Candidatus Moranbacteria bacterium]|nr:hypothetical protein [Candidatus Moranbacteria bacterium]